MNISTIKNLINSTKAVTDQINRKVRGSTPRKGIFFCFFSFNYRRNLILAHIFSTQRVCRRQVVIKVLAKLRKCGQAEKGLAPGRGLACVSPKVATWASNFPPSSPQGRFVIGDSLGYTSGKNSVRRDNHWTGNPRMVQIRSTVFIDYHFVSNLQFF